MKKIISFIKITILAFIFAFAIHFSYSYFSEDSQKNDIQLFEVDSLSSGLNNKSNITILWNIGVALTTNVWIKYKQREKNNLYKNIPWIWEIISNKNYSDKTSRRTHMDNIKEYYNILRTDIKSLLEKSYDRKDTLEAYIDQLKFRYNTTNENIKILSQKEKEYSRNLNIYSKKINKIRTKIKYDFNNFNWNNTEKNISELLKAKAEYNYANAYKIYISQYIKQYKYLNSNGKKLYDTLNNNKEAIIKNVQIVIPKTWTKNLKKLKLIINE